MARQLAMTLIREFTRLSLIEIGSLFDRDHGTVIHAIKATRRRIETDPTTAELYQRLADRAQD
jgi:chromosomal replication initiator protein